MKVSVMSIYVTELNFSNVKKGSEPSSSPHSHLENQKLKRSKRPLTCLNALRAAAQGINTTL